MLRLLVLVAGMLPAAPPGDARPIALRLEKGQEFLYRAVYTQESERPGTRFTRSLETHVLILDATPQGACAAFMTVHRLPGKPGVETSPTVQLELGRIDPFGRVKFDRTTSLPRVPIDGPPTLDPWPFIELPRTLPEPGQPWDVEDADQAPIRWRMLLSEPHQYGRCAKLKGEQSSGDWSVAGRTVWKREQMAWMSLNYGFVVQLERTTEWRTETGETWRSRLEAKLDSMPGPIPPEQFKDRRFEIHEAIRLDNELAELMKPRGEPDYRGYDALLRSIDRHAGRGTPYEVAVRSLRRKVEFARSGERPPEPKVVRTTKEPPKPADVDEAAPDFVAADLLGGDAVNSSQLRGRPAVLVFFRPSSKLAGHVLRYAQSAAKAYAGRVRVLAMAVEGEPAELAKLRTEHRLEIPLYDGRAALSLFAGRSTPRVVVLDQAGKVRLIGPGWGGEFPAWIHRELLQLAP